MRYTFFAIVDKKTGHILGAKFSPRYGETPAIFVEQASAWWALSYIGLGKSHTVKEVEVKAGES